MEYDKQQVQYELIWNKIDTLDENQSSPEFYQALQQLTELANDGFLDAADLLVEFQAFDGIHHNAESAYKWYFVLLSQRGYKTKFDDQNNIPPHYCGPIGDFRNECLVNDLVAELGFEKVRELDVEATAWLAERNLCYNPNR